MAAAASEVRAAIKATRRIAVRYEAKEFDEARSLFVSEHGPRVALVRFIAESSKNGQIEAREAARRLLVSLLPLSLEHELAREYGQRIRTSADELLEVLQVGQGGNGGSDGRCPRGQAQEWILSYLCEHHKYDGKSIGNWDPVKLDQVVSGLGGHPGRTSVSKWFGKHFGGHDLYRAACQNETLLPKLQKLRGDFDSLFDPEDVLLNRADPRALDPAHD